MPAKALARERIWQLLEQKLLPSNLAVLPTRGSSKGNQGAPGKVHLHSCHPLVQGATATRRSQ